MDAIQEEYEENGSDSSGDSSDSELAESMLQIENLRKLLAKSPFQYDSHVELISLLRQQGDLDGAREARRNMREQFPLTEALWLEWLGDELPLASLPEAVLELRMLFETATEDYLSVEVWLQFARFSIERMSMFPDGMAFPRDVFERGIVACGLHTSQATQLWNAYREFEGAVLSSLQAMQVADPADQEMQGQVEAQYEKVDKLFKRQLAVPLIDMESTFQEYQAFSERALEEKDLPMFVAAKKKLESLLPFENQLRECPPGSSSLDVYRSYLSHLGSSKSDPSLLSTLYQRALAAHSLDTPLWRDYLRFLTTSFSKVPSAVLPGHRQAVRNVPWEVEVWVAYARALERFSTPHEEVIMLFEKVVGGDNFTKSDSYLALWGAYCDYLRRRVDGEGGEGGEGVTRDSDKIEDLRKVFKRARESLSTYFGKDGDPTDSLSRYQASLEARCYGSMETARPLWDDVMSRHGKEAEFWLEYAQLERCYGEVPQCRKLLSRAVNSASDRPEVVCHALLRLEREAGSLASLEAAEERCANQLQRVKERREKAAEKEAQQKDEKLQQVKVARAQKKKDNKQQKPQQKSQQKPQRKQQQQKPKQQQQQQKQTQPEAAGPRRKRGRGSDHTFFDDNEEEITKRSKVDGSHDPTTTSVQQEAPRTHTTTQPPPVTHDDDSSTIQTQQQDEPHPEKSSETVDVKPTPPPAQQTNEPMDLGDGKVTGSKENEEEDEKERLSRTVFVSNLTSAVTEEQLQELFSECGTIADIRVVRKKLEYRTNVYAYVEFTTPEARPSALRLDRSSLNERPIYVSECRERKSQQQPAVAKTGPPRVFGNQEATVYVTGLAVSCEEKELQELFQECGEVKHVRIVRNRAGRAKGYAYVEFASTASAKSAVMKLDDHQFGFKRLGVAISNPPKRASGEEGERRMEVEGGGGGGGAQRMAVRGGGAGFRKPAFIPPRVERQERQGPHRSQISLVPRVLARKKTGGGGGGGGGAEGGEDGGGGRKSNEDFRNMLLKKT